MADELLKTLNDLIAACRDSAEGFGKAAKGAHAGDLRNLLTNWSKEHADFATLLAEHVRRLGGEPAARGHGGAILHPGWVDLETRIRPKDDATLIAECERGEESTLKHYQHAQDLPGDIRETVEWQAGRIQQTIDDLRRMEKVRRAV